MLRQGLSPRVRGNLEVGVPVGRERGSIPAGAGEPFIRPRSSPDQRVYPRGCGGTASPAQRGLIEEGLSPRVRGNPVGVLRVELRDGSIPAGAGEPGAVCPPRQNPKVYPRGCGGTREWRDMRRRTEGLSPRVRGNPHSRSNRALTRGSIPAGAGEPAIPGVREFLERVYPRGCGGTPAAWRGWSRPAGLSPRVRGNHLRAAWRDVYRGSIPAGAGEPGTQ